ncbi:MAG: hypothetical protein ABI388_11635 [Bacteroidia bacterium]
MIYEVKYPLVIAVVFLWIGFVCSISFMESWLKFKAPGVTLPIGLGIGSILFKVLNRVEWIFALIIFLSYLFTKEMPFSIKQFFFILPTMLLLVQTIWLLPVLDKRAHILIEGLSIPASNFHFYFVAAEVTKVVSLFIFSISLFQ